MHKGLPPIKYHDHSIHLQPKSLSPNIKPYRYLDAKKGEIRHMYKKF